MKSSEDCPDLLLQIVHFLRQGLLTNVVPIGNRQRSVEEHYHLANPPPLSVCSYQDSPAFMVKCLHEGAADFVLKPMSKDVIKTLFLVCENCRLFALHRLIFGLDRMLLDIMLNEAKRSHRTSIKYQRCV